MQDLRDHILALLDAAAPPAALRARARALEELLDAPPPSSLAPIPGPLDERLRTLVRLMAGNLTTTQVRHAGAVYTPPYIARRLITQSFALWRQDHPQGGLPTLCDPACGAGAFLIEALEFMTGPLELAPTQAVEQLIRGIDVDPAVAALARALLELALLARGADPTPARAAVRHADALLTPLPELLASLFDGQHPSVVVTNPPYVKLQNVPQEQREALARRWPTLARGSFSLSQLFIARCLELAGSEGICGLITQNNLFSSLAAEELRRMLKEGGHLRRIVDFSHQRIFEQVNACTCLLYLGGTPRDTFEYALIHAPQVESALESTPRSIIRRDELTPKKWRLAPRHHLDTLHHLERLGPRLGELCAIRVGFATLKDRAFLLRRQQGSIPGITPDGEVFEIEEDLTRPALKAPEIRALADITANTLRVLYPYREEGAGARLLEWDELASRFPNGAAYLERWRVELERRDRGRIDPRKWYGWGRVQALRAPGPKLVTPTFGLAPGFVLDPSDALICNGYGLWPRPALRAHGWTPELLARLLNSDVMHYYACLTSLHLNGGYQCYQKNFIERFCVPGLDPDTAERLQRAAPTEANDLLLALCGLAPEQARDLIDAYRPEP